MFACRTSARASRARWAASLSAGASFGPPRFASSAGIAHAGRAPLSESLRSSLRSILAFVPVPRRQPRESSNVYFGVALRWPHRNARRLRTHPASSLPTKSLNVHDPTSPMDRQFRDASRVHDGQSNASGCVTALWRRRRVVTAPTVASVCSVWTETRKKPIGYSV